MQRLLFESPLLLIPLLLIGLYALVVVWLRRRTPGTKRLALIGLLVCVVAPVVQQLVATDRERISAVCQGVVDATEDGDIEALAQHVSVAFDVRGMDRDAFLEGVERVLSRYHVEDAGLKQVEIDVTGSRATVRFAVNCAVVAHDEVVPIRPSTWIAEFEYVEGRWQMISVDTRYTPVFPFNGLEDLM